MNPKANLQNQMEILQAVMDGKQVMFRLHAQKGPWQVVKEDHVFNFGFNDYEIGGIPKEKSYRPWTYEEIVVGRAVKHKKINRESIIISKSTNSHGHTFVMIGSDVVSLYCLLEEYETIDGEPCGVEE